MTIIEIQIEEKNKIINGLKIAFEKLIEYKKANNREIVILKNNKILKINPKLLK